MLFNLFLKRVIIKDNGNIVIICNNGNSTKKSEQLNKVFAFDSTGEPDALVFEPIHIEKDFFYFIGKIPNVKQNTLL